MPSFDISALAEKDQKIIGEFGSLVSDITNDMENYNFYLAAEKFITISGTHLLI